MKRIILVRHGESTGNRDKLVYRETADFAVPLTEQGHRQAENCGRRLEDWIYNKVDLPENRGGVATVSQSRWRVWTSPYTRTRQTAQGVIKHLEPTRIIDVREHLLLVEQMFGCLNGIAGKQVRDHFPAVADDYDRQQASGSKFFARPWGGESRYDCAVRMHQAFGTFQRDFDKHGIDNLIIISHGTAIRCFVMMWLHLPYEWVDLEPNPGNASARLIQSGPDGWEDKGYIFEGYKNA